MMQKSLRYYNKQQKYVLDRVWFCGVNAILKPTGTSLRLIRDPFRSQFDILRAIVADQQQILTLLSYSGKAAHHACRKILSTHQWKPTLLAAGHLVCNLYCTYVRMDCRFPVA